jgi:hypothetical protein
MRRVRDAANRQGLNPPEQPRPLAGEGISSWRRSRPEPVHDGNGVVEANLALTELGEIAMQNFVLVVVNGVPLATLELNTKV